MPRVRVADRQHVGRNAESLSVGPRAARERVERGVERGSQSYRGGKDAGDQRSRRRGRPGTALTSVTDAIGLTGS